MNTLPEKSDKRYKQVTSQKIKYVFIYVKWCSCFLGNTCYNDLKKKIPFLQKLLLIALT